MSETYSTYDAKARFSEILRKVRQGKTITVSYHGEPVAEIRPIGAGASGLERRLQTLEGLGIIVPAERQKGRFVPIAHRPGALDRFLSERDD